MTSSSRSGRASFTLDATVVARGAELLHAQCWLWGHDLRSPRGNLLEACGLEGSVFEGARSHRRYYRAQLEERRFVVAWSGGVVFGDESGALFFRRLKFAPRRLDDVRSLEAVPDLNAMPADSAPLLPKSDTRVLGALEWLAVYEDAVSSHAGPAWRTACASLWARIEEGARAVAASVGVRYQPLPPLPENGLADSWRKLRYEIARGAESER